MSDEFLNLPPDDDDDELDFDWLSDSDDAPESTTDSSRTGVTGDLDWLGDDDISDDDVPGDDESASFDWQQASTDNNYDLNDSDDDLDLDWQADDSPADFEPDDDEDLDAGLFSGIRPAMAEQQMEAFLDAAEEFEADQVEEELDWMMEPDDLADDFDDDPTEDHAPADLPDWLMGMDVDAASDEDLDDAQDLLDETSSEPSGVIKSLNPLQPPVPDDEPEAAIPDEPDWLSGADDMFGDMGDSGFLAEPDLPDDISDDPDWLSGTDELISDMGDSGFLAEPDLPDDISDDPDWLSGTDELASDMGDSGFLAEPDLPDDISGEPDWLAGADDDFLTELAQSESPESMDTGDEMPIESDMPDWLAGMEMPDISDDETLDLPTTDELLASTLPDDTDDGDEVSLADLMAASGTDDEDLDSLLADLETVESSESPGAVDDDLSDLLMGIGSADESDAVPDDSDIDEMDEFAAIFDGDADNLLTDDADTDRDTSDTIPASMELDEFADIFAGDADDLLPDEIDDDDLDDLSDEELEAIFAVDDGFLEDDDLDWSDTPDTPEDATRPVAPDADEDWLQQLAQSQIDEAEPQASADTDDDLEAALDDDEFAVLFEDEHGLEWLDVSEDNMLPEDEDTMFAVLDMDKLSASSLDNFAEYKKGAQDAEDIAEAEEAPVAATDTEPELADDDFDFEDIFGLDDDDEALLAEDWSDETAGVDDDELEDYAAILAAADEDDEDLAWLDEFNTDKPDTGSLAEADDLAWLGEIEQQPDQPETDTDMSFLDLEPDVDPEGFIISDDESDTFEGFEEEDIFDPVTIDSFDDQASFDALSRGDDVDFDDDFLGDDFDDLPLPDPEAQPDSAPAAELQTSDLEDIFSTLDEAAERSTESKRRLPDNADMPEWLREVAQQEAVDTLSAAAIIRRQKDRPIEELDERLLALRDSGLNLRAEQADTAEQQADSIDILPDAEHQLTPFKEENIAVSLSQTLNLTDTQVSQAALLGTLAGMTGASDTERRTRRLHLPLLQLVRLDRLLISLLLLAVVILPFFIDLNIGSLPPAAFPPGSAASDAFVRVAVLQPGDLVLVAAEYGPTGAVELDALTQNVLTHILSTGARPLIVSTNPIGLIHAENLITDIAGEDFRNQSYYVARVLPGENLGVRDFNENLTALLQTDSRNQTTNLNINSFDDFALAILITESYENARTWIEQVSPDTNTPFIIGTGYAAMPLIMPYADSIQNVAGLLVGYEDAYTYNTMLGDLNAQVDVPVATSTPTPLPVTPSPTLPSPTPTTPPPTQTPTPEITETPVITNTPDTPEPTETVETPAVSPTPTETVETPAVSPTPSPTLTPSPTPTVATVQIARVIAGGAVNVRSAPNGNIISTLSPGAVLPVLGVSDTGDWVNVELDNGLDGWIAAFLLTIEDVPADELEDDDAQSRQPGQTVRVAMRRQVSRDKMPHLNFSPPQQVTPDVTAAPAEATESPAVLTITSQPITDRDTRWRAITAGTIAAILVIIGGNLFYIGRSIIRRGQ